MKILNRYFLPLNYKDDEDMGAIPKVVTNGLRRHRWTIKTEYKPYNHYISLRTYIQIQQKKRKAKWMSIDEDMTIIPKTKEGGRLAKRKTICKLQPTKSNDISLPTVCI